MATAADPLSRKRIGDIGASMAFPACSVKAIVEGVWKVALVSLRGAAGDEAISQMAENQGRDCFAPLAMTALPPFPNTL